MNKNKIYIKLIASIYIFSLVINAQIAFAGNLTGLSNTMSRLKASEASNHDIRFKSESGVSSGNITINFNAAGFSSGSVNYSDIDLQYGSSQSEVNGSCSSNCTKASLNSAPGAGVWGAAYTSNNLILAYPSSGGTAIAANDYVRVLIGTNATYEATGDQQMTNPGSTGSKSINISTASDTGQLAVAIVTNDQLSVTANVDPSLTFSISDNAVSLGTLSSTSVTPDAEIFEVSTNADTGYNVTITGNTLTHGNGTDVINEIGNTPATSTTNTEQFGINLVDNSSPNIGANPSGGSGSAASGFGTTNNFKYYAAGNPQTIASASGPSATTTFTISFIANIAAQTEAGTYTTTLTLIATGNF